MYELYLSFLFRNNGKFHVECNSQEKLRISRILIIKLYCWKKISTDTFILAKRHLYYTCTIRHLHYV